MEEKAINVFQAITMLENFKEHIEAFDASVQALEQSDKNEKHIQTLKKLRKDYLKNQKDLEEKLKETQIQL